MEIEKAFLFGTRKEITTTANNYIRLTGGFTYFATSNVTNLAGVTLSEPDLESALADIFQHTASGDSRVAFCSPLVISAIDMLGVGKLMTVPSDQTYGIAVQQYRTAHGTLNLVKHRLLVNGGGGTGWGSWAFFVDPKMLKQRTLSGGGTKLLTDRQSPGVDGWVDEYLTETGLQLTNKEVHGTIKNVGAAA